MTMTTEGVAPGHPARCQRKTTDDAVAFNCFGGIGRAGRKISTGSGAKLAVLLVPAKRHKHCPLHQLTPGLIDRADQRQDVSLELIKTQGCWFRILDTDEVEPGAQLDCFVRKYGTNTASDPVPHHGISD